MSYLLTPFLDCRVHLHCEALGVCANGTLSENYGELTFTGAPGLRFDRGTLEWITAAPQIGPREWPDFPDLAMEINNVTVFLYAVLRDPLCH